MDMCNVRCDVNSTLMEGIINVMNTNRAEMGNIQREETLL